MRSSIPHYGLRPVISAALSDKAFCYREKSGRLPAVSFASQHGIGGLVGPVAPLVKGQRRLDLDASFRGIDPVQQGRHMPVIPQIVGGTGIERNRCRRRQG
ncbi:hypothetical protein D3C75_417370 [compost metagenome]